MLGVKGDVWENWNYDVSATYSQVVFSQTYLNDFSTTRTNRAMDVIVDPATGLPACRSVVDGSDPTCVPYNIWHIGGVTQEALDYLQIPLFSNGDTELKTVAGIAGVRPRQLRPQAPDGQRRHRRRGRRQLLRDEPRFPAPTRTIASGDGAGQGGPTIGQTGGYNAIELFGEVRVPILQGMPFADSLLLNASYRRSDYSEPIDESTDTYGVGLEWAPVQDVKFRGSFQRAVRAPSIIELYQAQGLGLFNMGGDPCSGTTPTATLEQCVATDLDPALYGTGDVENNAAGQYNGFFGGNHELIPETADSYTIGFVLQPRFLEGFSLTVDYWNISVEDVISTIPPNITIAECVDTLNPVFCDKINRDSNGSLWASPDAFVECAQPEHRWPRHHRLGRRRRVTAPTSATWAR